MIEDLSQYHQDDIGAAFLKWRRTASKIPTPAEIIKLTEAARVTRIGLGKTKTLQDFSGDWKEYQKYLKGEYYEQA